VPESPLKNHTLRSEAVNIGTDYILASVTSQLTPQIIQCNKKAQSGFPKRVFRHLLLDPLQYQPHEPIKQVV